MANMHHDYSQKLEEEIDMNDAIKQEDIKSELVDIENQFDSFIAPRSSMTVDSESPRSLYYGIDNKEKSSVTSDHCYARPWNWKPETNFLRPTKTLFIPKCTMKMKFPGQLAPIDNEEDIIDIENIQSTPLPIYDVNKANQLMEECENHVKLFKTEEGNENWEEEIMKRTWTPTQTRLINGVLNILNNHRLAKLASSGVDYEAICRRTTIDKSVQRVRRLLATVFWDQKLTQWLHQLLVDHLSTSYLAMYLEILQTLKAKLPSFVEKMIYGQTAFKIGSLSTENLLPMLKRPWDPVISSLMQDKPKKLPGNPIIIVIPSSPVTSNRYLKWINLLTNLATVVNVPFNLGAPGQRLTTMHCADQMFASIRGQVQEIKNEHPNKNVVLLGFNSGAAMALQVAQVEPVLAVICLGFSLLTAEGKRGEPDDTLLELASPVLFVIGQCSTTSSQEDMEDLRERMRIETGLVVVGSADNYLRISKKKKRTEGITQSVVDRCIVDEIGEFISGIILSPYPPQVRQSPTHVPPDPLQVKKTKSERKRYNSNASSLDSEDHMSPLPPRISRPVGRPPGSKSKSKLEVKWAAQVAQGTSTSTAVAATNNPVPQNPATPSPSITPPLTPNTYDSSSNDSSLDKQTVEKFVSSFPPNIRIVSDSQIPQKKVRTMKPVVHKSSSDKSPAKTVGGSPVKGSQMKSWPTSPTAKMQAYGMAKHNLISGSRLSSLLQGGIKTIPPSQPKTSASGVRVLENVTITPGNTKILSNAVSKTVTVLNPGTTLKQTSSNVILLPDGKIKTIGPGNIIKGTRYITSKKQLLGNKPPKPVKKVTSYKPPPTITTNLPPPTNLTTQDIMDLPIIFADDNQIIDAPMPEIVAPPPQQTTPTLTPSTPKILTPGSKFVLVNKPINFSTSSTNFVISQTPIKKPHTVYRQTPKYTKIILSKRTPTEDLKSANIISRIANLSPEISVKKVSSPVTSTSSMINMENIDLENELVATTIPKPIYTGDIKNITITQKMVGSQGESYIETLERMREENLKRLTSPVEDDDSDPDYVPPKVVKLN